MELCIDIGNSRAKIGVFDNGKLIAVERTFSTDIAEIIKRATEYPFSRSIVCSVSEDERSVCTTLKEYGECLFLDHRTKVPVRITYKTPETLGKDRLAAVVGARSLYPGEDLAIIDLGTCATFDFIDKNGNYHGGNITPGLEMRLEAMHVFTKRLPRVSSDGPVELLGKTTEKALRNGAINGLCWEMEGFVGALKNEGYTPRLVLTGGSSYIFEETLKTEIFVQPNLVLIGLHEILQYNPA